jgi:hypothetical protein
MRTRRLALALSAGLAVGLFVSACGVAVGPVQFTGEGPAALNPVFSGLHLPQLAGQTQPALAGSLHHLQYLRVNNQALSLDAFGAGSCHLEP